MKAVWMIDYCKMSEMEEPVKERVGEQ